MMLEGLDHPILEKMEIDTYYLMAKRLVFLNKLENITRFASLSYVYLQILIQPFGHLKIIYQSFE